MLLELILATKKTLIDIMWHVYWSAVFSVQKLSLQHLSVDIRHNNNALKELNDCIGGLLHLGLDVITLEGASHSCTKMYEWNLITWKTSFTSQSKDKK